MNARRGAASADPAQRCLFAEPDLPTLMPAPRPAGPASTSGAASASDFPESLLRHPQAEREFRFGEHRIGYAFRRARRRSIGFVVGPEGLSVSAPRWVGLRDVEAALAEKGDWIVRKLVEQRERSRRLDAARIEWRDGTIVPFLGQPVTIVLDPLASAPGGAQLDVAADQNLAAPDRALRIALARGATPEQIRDVVQGWLQRQARRVFEERCGIYAARLGVRVSRIALSSAQTRWGSANANGAIRLNWRLIHFALPTIDYVVAHELAHLREMNHSPRFWDVVRSVVPDYEQARATLRRDALPAID